MTSEQWLKLLPKGSVISSCNSKFGSDKPWHYKDYLMVVLPNQNHLEVMWDDDIEKYEVVVTTDHFNTVIIKEYYEDANSTMNGVRLLSEMK